ncbi:MAG: Gfo/Idh/MocA family oxidoreductase [Desulfobacterales bacterium]|nr:Gfo/Idh/MocA family oxidoreductase [Desulfobacterales bacterium]MDP6808195.1 Gfo/Idh/MocA family oxidoreductase [Desulfobacterales bacterium]
MGEIRKQIVEQNSETELSAVCDPFVNRETMDIACAYYDDYRKAIDVERPDIVFVCTPNRFIPDVATYALQQGCHIFCEKPPGRCLMDIQRIREMERNYSELKVMFGFNHRHHPAIIEAKAIVDAGRMGKIMWMRGVYGKSGGQGRDFESSWRNNPDMSGGGILLDQGIHMLDLFRFFCGDFQEITGMLTTAFWNIPVEDNAFVFLRNDRGQMAQLHSSATLWKHIFRLEIGLERGYLIAQGLLSKTGSYGREHLIIGRRPNREEQAAVGSPREETVYFDNDLSWELQVRDLILCIQEDSPVTDSSSLDALRVMEIIDTVYRTAKQHPNDRRIERGVA